VRRPRTSARTGGAASAGGSSSTSSPPSSLWLFGRGAPSTRTPPASSSRSAAARDPTSGRPARKRSSRVPAAPLGTRRRVSDAPRAARIAVRRDEGGQQDPDPDDDEAVREVERRPEAQVEEVGHVAEPDPVDEIRDAAADQQAERRRQHRVPSAGA